MAPRPTWKGYLKLSLVSCPVALYTATSTSSRIRLHVLNRKTGHRIHNQIVDAETGKVVEPEDRVKGYELDDGEHVLLEDEELDEVALESTHTMDIESFVARNEVDEIYLDESFYLVPNGEAGEEAFAVIREAMKKTDMVGLARVVMHRRERLLMLQPRGKGIMATALRYRNEVRGEERYFDDIPSARIPGDMIDLAEHIIDQKKAAFDPKKFEDRYEEALSALIKAKRAGKPPPAAPAPEKSNVVSLMDALRRSVQSERGGPSHPRAAHRSAAHPHKRRSHASRRTRMKRAS
jgi:DNA end-binding protein Ku